MHLTCKSLKVNGGSVCESNAPLTSKMPIAGFEDREGHRTPFASALHTRVRPAEERSPALALDTSGNGDCNSAGHACLRLVTEAIRASLPVSELLLH